MTAQVHQAARAQATMLRRQAVLHHGVLTGTTGETVLGMHSNAVSSLANRSATAGAMQATGQARQDQQATV